MVSPILKIHGSSSCISFECEKDRITANGEFFAEDGEIAGFSVSTSSLKHENGELLSSDECRELKEQFELYMSNPHALKNYNLKFE